jgi:hypothetical protein
VSHISTLQCSEELLTPFSIHCGLVQLQCKVDGDFYRPGQEVFNIPHQKSKRVAERRRIQLTTRTPFVLGSLSESGELIEERISTGVTKPGNKAIEGVGDDDDSNIPKNGGGKASVASPAMQQTPATTTSEVDNNDPTLTESKQNDSSDDSTLQEDVHATGQSSGSIKSTANQDSGASR